MTRPRPYADRDSAPWWEGVSRHELLTQQCSDCGRLRWPAREMCGDCAALRWTWAPASGQGAIVSAIRTHHQFLPDVPAPYWTVFVALDEQTDIVMPGSWHSDETPIIGMAVLVDFEDVAADGDGDGDGFTLVGWRPA